MTARWSSVFLEIAAATLRQRGGSRRRTPAVSAGARRAVSEDGVLLWVLVTRTSVVEMSWKHLGNVLEECRKARGVQCRKAAASLTRAMAKQPGRRPTWNGVEVILQAQGCSDGSGAGARKRLKRRTWASEGRKIGASPSMVMSANSLTRDRDLQRCPLAAVDQAHGRRMGSRAWMH